MDVLLSEFRQRVLADPGKAAVVEGDRTLTYGQLDAMSSSIANGLLAGPPTAQPVVAVVSWLGLEGIAVHQAVLKAGMVIAPLDPREPDEVLLANAEKLGARMVLLDRQRAAGLSPAGPRSAVSTPDQLDSGTTTAPQVQFDPARPILLGATSGSTGKSRSVVFPQSIIDVMNEMRLVHSPHERVGVMLPPMFVAANGPITSSWRSGATAYCYDLSSQPLEELPGWMERLELTAFALTPSLVRMVFDPWLEQARPLPHVSRVTLTGETLTGSDVGVLRKLFPNATFLNVYGSADAALVSRFEIPPSLEVPDGPVSVGKPLRPVEILDEEGEAATQGEVGIINVVGDWLPMPLELDAPLDLASLDLDRVRKAPTGDLGRIAPDGTLELLGRADHRVKVRGQMVDPSRVEAALVGLADVQDAVVSAVPREGTNTLVAHVVPSGDSAPRARDLRRALRPSLPSFMVPSTFLVVAELPRLSSGKADRTLLREVAAKAAPEPVPSSPPVGEVEEKLAGIFAKVLDLDSVGRDDDFFDLGGDSISAVELITSVESSFGKLLEVSAVVDGPTVAELARKLAERGGTEHGLRTARAGLRLDLRPWRDEGRRIVALQREGSRVPIYVVPGGGNNLFHLQPLAGALTDRPTYELVPKGVDSRTWPNYSVESAARRYMEALEEVEDPFIVAGYSVGALVAWEMARELTARGRPPARLLLLDGSGFEPRASFRARMGSMVERFASAARDLAGGGGETPSARRAPGTASRAEAGPRAGGARCGAAAHQGAPCCGPRGAPHRQDVGSPVDGRSASQGSRPRRQALHGRQLVRSTPLPSPALRWPHRGRGVEGSPGEATLRAGSRSSTATG